MVKDGETTTRDAAGGLWFHVGLRLHERREQLGLTAQAVAAHLGVVLGRYEQFETGRLRIPAVLLAQAGDLLGVPLYHFFCDIPSAEDDVNRAGPDGDSGFVVATDADRLDALVKDYMRLSREGQSCLLMLARALAQECESQ